MSELDPLLRRAYSAARAERPRSGKGKAQTLAALGLSTATATATATAQASVGAAGGSVAAGGRLLSTWPWWGIGVALVVTSGAVLWSVEDPSAPPAVVSAPVAPLASSAADTAAPVLTVDQLPNAAEPPNVADGPKPTEATKAAASASLRPAGRPATAPESTAAAADSLRDEIEAIERASSALSQRRCALARSHLSAYDARFPNGRLRREADVVGIEIAGRSGQRDRARTAARSFVAQFPDTPYALRLAPWLRDDATEEAGPTSVVTCIDAAE
ncbi:MAG: hypothetical protein KF894_00920 [Labilithrix sp.]|nr:hypothetical protein [Labilithrix sp.]